MRVAVVAGPRAHATLVSDAVLLADKLDLRFGEPRLGRLGKGQMRQPRAQVFIGRVVILWGGVVFEVGGNVCAAFGG